MNAQDRCDSCGAAALVRVKSPKTGNVLDLCGHHLRKFSVSIANWIVVERNGEP